MINVKACPDYAKLYATDASVYEQVPSSVAFPTCVNDCVDLVRWANEKGFSLIGRGGGTSIAGQCVGSGVVVDFSRYMAGIIAPPKDGAIWVQPGTVLDDLNDDLRPLGLQFPIDISTSSRCTIGGMAGNNAAGSHSIVYGATRENVLEVDVVLFDGSTVRFGPLDENSLREKMKLPGCEGDIYRSVFAMIDGHRDTILAAYPDPSVIRRNTGYALDVLAMGQPWVSSGPLFNLSSLLCGSEGTLALVTAIRLKLSPVVAGKALACIHFATLNAALLANGRLLTFEGLAACELIDAHVLRAAAGHPGQQSNCDWVEGDPAAILAAEFFGDTPAKARKLAEQAVGMLKAEGIGIAWPVMDGCQAYRVWALRKAGLGLLMGLRQRARPVAVIEDSAVPVAALPDFAYDIGQMMHQFGIDCVFYGHASVGLLHLRPVLDLGADADRAIFRSIASEAAVLVKHYRGSLSGEHGDGRLRAPYLKEFLGEDVYEILKNIKQTFDPAGIFNPGKILSHEAVDTQVRQSSGFALETCSGFNWRESNGFDLALERCNGSGNCRQKSSRGAMCPTFQVTGDELYSTRGRANLLRHAFSSPDAERLNSPMLVEAMDTCLGCKACQTECPSGVDMTQMKSEYLFRRRQGRLFYALQCRVMGMQPWWLGSFAAMPAFVRLLLGRLGRTKPVMRIFRLERKPPMPAAIAMSRLIRKRSVGEYAANRSGEPVLLLIDPFVNHFEPDVGEAAISVLQSLGYAPSVHFMDCSLRWLVSEGFPDEAKKGLERLSDSLSSRDDVPIIGLEPAELLLLRNEALDLMEDSWSAGFPDRCFLLDEFLLHEYAANRLQSRALSDSDYTVNVHPHCHERAADETLTLIKLLTTVFGLKSKVISSGCCGMGGSFGYCHSELSKKIFQNNVQLPAREEVPIPLLVSGASCRQQFRDLSGAEQPLHPAQFLRDVLTKYQG